MEYYFNIKQGRLEEIGLNNHFFVKKIYQPLSRKQSGNHLKQE